LAGCSSKELKRVSLMSSEIQDFRSGVALPNPVIEVIGISKAYQIYGKPQDRLKQLIIPGKRKFYREFWALRDINFSVNRGQTLGIIGRNGSGKSTLLQIVCGTLTPTSGEVKIRGRIAARTFSSMGPYSDFRERRSIKDFSRSSILPR